METFFQFTTALTDFVWFSSLKASLLIVAVLLAQRLLARLLSVRGRYLLWLAVVLGLVTPIGFTVGIPQLPALSSLTTTPVSVPMIGAGDGKTLPPLSVPETLRNRSMPAQGSVVAALAEPVKSATRFSLADTLSVVWLSGVLLFMAAVLFRHHRFARVVRAALPASVALQDLLDDCRQQVHCQRKVRLLCSGGIDAPLITGSFRSLLILPVGIEHQLNEAQLRHVFVHELMHVKHYDIATNWVLTLLQAVHWFNPLVWLGFSQLRFDRELARDAATLDCLAAGDRQQYGQTLLQLSQPLNRHPQTAGAVGIVDDHLQLKRRITMIIRNSLPSRIQTLVAGALLLLLGTLAFSKPDVDSSTAASAASSTVAVPAKAARVAAEPAVAETMPVVNSASVEVVAAVQTPAAVTATRTVPAKKAATAITVAAQATAEINHNEFAAPAAKPVMTVALADNELSLVAPSSGNTAGGKREIYADWDDIVELAKASSEARAPAVKFLTKLNTMAEACLQQQSKAQYYPSSADRCEDLVEAIRKNQIVNFTGQCSELVRTYNRLAANFSGAKVSQFTDQQLVKSMLEKNQQTLGEFCNANAYQQKYPKLDSLLTNPQWEVKRVMNPNMFIPSPPDNGHSDTITIDGRVFSLVPQPNN